MNSKLRRVVLLFGVSLAACGATGCSMCKNPYDCMYGAYGGSQPRTDMVHGRVGSLFEPAGMTSTPAPVPTESIVLEPTPDVHEVAPIVE